MSIIRRRPASTPEPQLDPVAEALAAQLLQQWTQDGAAQRTDDQDGDGQPGDNWASDNRSSDHQDSDNWDSDGQPAHVAGEEAVVNDQNDTARPPAGLRVDIVTIFPSYLEPLELSLIGRARTSGLIDVQIHDLRDFTADRHRTVDDAPAGGGAGMVMRPEPWGDAIASLLVRGRKALGQEDAAPLLLIPSPSGATLTQGLARDLAQVPWLAIACGRYEGIDERVFDEAAAQMPVLPVSLGDYVLNGGEVAALAIVEAVGRLVPGVVGNAESLVEESYEDGLLEYPVYTRPASWRGRDVPPVLSSGHHAKIKRWRRDQALERTAQRRPDLIERLDPARLDGADLVILTAAGWRLADGRFQPPAWPVAD